MVELRDIELHGDRYEGDGHVVLEYRNRAYAVCFDSEGPYEHHGWHFHDWNENIHGLTIDGRVDYNPHPTVWIENGDIYV